MTSAGGGGGNAEAWLEDASLSETCTRPGGRDTELS